MMDHLSDDTVSLASYMEGEEEEEEEEDVCSLSSLSLTSATAAAAMDGYVHVHVLLHVCGM